MIMKPIKENPKQCRAERTALTNAHLLSPRLPSCASHLHGERPTRVQRLNGCQHTRANPNGLQLAPQHVMLDSIICFLQVHEAGIEGALSKAGRVNEVAKGEKVMDGGLARSEACLGWSCIANLVLQASAPWREREREIHYVHSASLAYEDGIVSKMLRGACVCPCGTRTRSLSAIVSLPCCRRLRHEHNPVLISQAG